jgi:hypothetical protein
LTVTTGENGYNPMGQYTIRNGIDVISNDFLSALQSCSENNDCKGIEVNNTDKIFTLKNVPGNIKPNIEPSNKNNTVLFMKPKSPNPSHFSTPNKVPINIQVDNDTWNSFTKGPSMIKGFDFNSQLKYISGNTMLLNKSVEDKLNQKVIETFDGNILQSGQNQLFNQMSNDQNRLIGNMSYFDVHDIDIMNKNISDTNYSKSELDHKKLINDIIVSDIEIGKNQKMLTNLIITIIFFIFIFISVMFLRSSNILSSDTSILDSTNNLSLENIQNQGSISLQGIQETGDSVLQTIKENIPDISNTTNAIGSGLDYLSDLSSEINVFKEK